MIEYHTHVAAVTTTLETLQVASGAPDIADAAAHLADILQRELPVARLGSCLDALLTHADTDGHELDLLGRTADLWQRGLALYEEIRTARTEFELALLRDDIANPLEVAQMGLDRMARVRNTALDMQGELKTIQAEVRQLKHIPAHPRQSDRPSSDWRWGDAFAGRRTQAFVQAMFAHAQGERGTALAAGALAGYAGNVAGSAFLGHAVGGPRRLHRFRHRLARNTLGAWMHAKAATPDLGDLAGEFRTASDPERRDPPTLSADLAQQIAAALADAFPSRQPADLAAGFARMITHLETLGRFHMPPPPETPPIILSADGSPVTVEGASFDPLLKPQDVGGAGGLGGEPQTGTGEDPGKASGSEGSCGALALLIAVLLFIVVYIIWCLVRLADNKKCGVEDYFDEFSEDPPDPRDPPNQMTQQGLDAMRKPESAAHLIKDIFDVQMRLWQAFEAARNALVVHGLIYPPPAALQQKLHRQFLIAFTAGPWPRSEVPAAEASFQSYPMTPAEQPPQPSPYPATREPDWLLRVGLADNESTFSEIALAAFRALQDGARPEDHANLDLDADRSRRHTCWTVAAGTSITDPALSVEILSFASE